MENKIRNSMMLKGGNTYQEKIEWLIQQLAQRDQEIELLDARDVAWSQKKEQLEEEIEGLKDAIKSRNILQDELASERDHYKALAEACLPYIHDLQAENINEPSVGCFFDQKLADLYQSLKTQTP